MTSNFFQSIYLLLVKVVFLCIGIYILSMSTTANAQYPNLNSQQQKLMSKWLKADERCLNSYFYDQSYPIDTIFDCYQLTLDYIFFTKSSYTFDIDFENDEESNSNHFIIDALGEKILSSNLSTGDLTRILKIAAGTYKTNPKFIKQLILKGASTKDISPEPDLRQWTEYNCEILEIIIRNNEQLYRDKTAKHWEGDLLSITDSSMPYSICPKAIELLIKYSPELLNKRDNMSPAQQIVIAFNKESIQPDLVLKLMTTENVRMYSNIGNANMMHILLEDYAGAPDRTEDALLEYVPVIVKFIRLGGNMYTLDNDGYSALHYLKKFPEVFQAVNNELEKEKISKLY